MARLASPLFVLAPFQRVTKAPKTCTHGSAVSSGAVAPHHKPRSPPCVPRPAKLMPHPKAQGPPLSASTSCHESQASRPAAMRTVGSRCHHYRGDRVVATDRERSDGQSRRFGHARAPAARVGCTYVHITAIRLGVGAPAKAVLADDLRRPLALTRLRTMEGALEIVETREPDGEVAHQARRVCLSVRYLGARVVDHQA